MAAKLSPLPRLLCKKISRREDLANIEVAGPGEIGEIQVRMGFPEFVEEVLQDRFGIDANEFFSKYTMEQIDIARMDAETVVHHREMTDAFGEKAMDRAHHVGGVQGMHQVSDSPSASFLGSIFRVSSSSYISSVRSAVATRIGFGCRVS